MKEACPCGSGATYAKCCGRLHSGAEKAVTAEALMRSRYSAFVLGLEDYLLATWHPDTRPASLDLGEDSGTRWLGLEVCRHEPLDADHARVDFVARWRFEGRGHRLHEISNFVREEGVWYYLDGQILEK
jgi:SEC-C motif-containing protein